MSGSSRPGLLLPALFVLVALVVGACTGAATGTPGTASVTPGASARPSVAAATPMPTASPAPKTSATVRPSATAKPAATVKPISGPTPARPDIDPDSGLPVLPLMGLPPEADAVLAAINAGGPFDHAQDGSTFQNRERLLPQQPRGYYREYTVPTPGSPDRGARRIVMGREGEMYYTDDHYESFWRVFP